jgi:hypothetical protein
MIIADSLKQPLSKPAKLSTVFEGMKTISKPHFPIEIHTFQEIRSTDE